MLYTRVRREHAIKIQQRKERGEERLEMSLLEDFLVALDLVADSELSPVFKRNTALGVFAHLGHVFLDVLQG